MKRRNFLKIFPAASVSPFMVNGFPMRPFSNSKISQVLNSCDGINDRVLVLIQLKGGNDGLNCVIPIPQYDAYAELRPIIKVPETGPEKFIRLDNTLPSADQVGLHPTMSGMKEMYDKGWMSIVQAVGYESMNGSHFKGTDLWMSGGDGTPDHFNIRSGWMARALQAMYPNIQGAPIPPDQVYPLGIQIGDPNPSLGFHAETDHQNVINLYGQDPAGFYTLVQTIGGTPLANLPDSEYGDELEYIMGVEKAVDEYSVYITQAFNAGSNAITSYPQTTLAYQLKTVARLIKGGCKTKIYLCNMGGFDTHGDQLAPEGIVTEGGHADLLRTLSDAVRYFFNDLHEMGLGEQVAACTFSEFGRCARENGSKGTDHGTLAPMFIFGEAIKAGVQGTNVDLANLAGDNQLQGMQFDYRQVFTTLLQDWLGASNEVLATTLFTDYAKLPFVDANFVVSPDCYIGGTVDVWEGAIVKNSMKVSPNPAVVRAEVSFHAHQPFEGKLTVHSLGGAVVSSMLVNVQPGTNRYFLDVRTLPAATYFVRLENRRTGAAEVIKLIKS
ncbi:MAG: DUF1501 domain-containing protein [Saprospiraceae bacterium]|nr:DUF1501 domain-containing protein [Saprospiraceae bacterium]